MNNNTTPETPEQKEARRQAHIAKGDVCAGWHCSYPEPDGEWCVNCGYPVTTETQKSWEGHLPIGKEHTELLKKLAEWKEAK